METDAGRRVSVSCTPDASGNIGVDIVGGTLASAPAMAAVMLPVDQKYGRQGQANTVLYPLAQQKPAAFHDITLGAIGTPASRATPTARSTLPVSWHGQALVGAGRAAQGMPSHNSPPSVYNYADGFESKAVERLISRNLVAALYRTKRTGARQ
jgi:hypothetical protein